MVWVNGKRYKIKTYQLEKSKWFWIFCEKCNKRINAPFKEGIMAHIEECNG